MLLMARGLGRYSGGLPFESRAFLPFVSITAQTARPKQPASFHAVISTNEVIAVASERKPGDASVHVSPIGHATMQRF